MSNTRGMPGGMFKLPFDWYITLDPRLVTLDTCLITLDRRPSTLDSRPSTKRQTPNNGFDYIPLSNSNERYGLPLSSIEIWLDFVILDAPGGSSTYFRFMEYIFSLSGWL